MDWNPLDGDFNFSDEYQESSNGMNGVSIYHESDPSSEDQEPYNEVDKDCYEEGSGSPIENGLYDQTECLSVEDPERCGAIIPHRRYRTALQSQCAWTYQIPCSSAPDSGYMDCDDSTWSKLNSLTVVGSRKRTLTEPSLSVDCQDDFGSSDISCDLQLQIVEQPEATYRARYFTEKCCGPIKSCKNGGFPSIKIRGSIVDDMWLQVAVVNAKDENPHPLFQAFPAGKRSSIATVAVREDGSHYISMPLKDQQRVITLDNVGVIKLKEEEAKMRPYYTNLSKLPKSERSIFRLLFQIVGANESHIMTQSSTNIITCIGKDQGPPDIKSVYKVSSDSMSGERQLCITGKRFNKRATVTFHMLAENGFNECQEVSGNSIIHSSRESIVCSVPLSMPVDIPVTMRVSVKNPLQSSPPTEFTYEPDCAFNRQQHQVTSWEGREDMSSINTPLDEDQVPSVIESLRAI